MKDMKALLMTRRDDLTDRQARLERDAQRAGDPLSADFAEQAVQRENDDVVDRLREVTAAELEAVAAALARLANGTYGACATCGKPIDAARLAALPTSTRCLDCEALVQAI